MTEKSSICECCRPLVSPSNGLIWPAGNDRTDYLSNYVPACLYSSHMTGIFHKATDKLLKPLAS